MTMLYSTTQLLQKVTKAGLFSCRHCPLQSRCLFIAPCSASCCTGSGAASQEAGGEFNFPETITSLSYQLRSIYQRLLWDYEQMYFWRNTGPRVPSVAASAAPKAEATEARCVSTHSTAHDESERGLPLQVHLQGKASAHPACWLKHKQRMTESACASQPLQAWVHGMLHCGQWQGVTQRHGACTVWLLSSVNKLRRADEKGFAERVLQRAQRKRARPTEQRDVVVTAFPALPAGTPIQLTAMSIGKGPAHL